MSSTLYIYVMFCPYFFISPYIDHKLGNRMLTVVEVFKNINGMYLFI